MGRRIVFGGMSPRPPPARSIGELQCCLSVVQYSDGRRPLPLRGCTKWSDSRNHGHKHQQERRIDRVFIPVDVISLAKNNTVTAAYGPGAMGMKNAHTHA